MKLEKALLELKKLLNKWGLKEREWFLALHYADILQGYNIPYDRNAHIHIMLPYTKIPWEVGKKTIARDISIPSKSKYGKDLNDFIGRTGHDFEFVSEDPKYFRFLRANHSFEYQIGGDRIRMITVYGNLIWTERYMKIFAKKMTPEIVARRLSWRIAKYDKAKQKGDKKIMRLAKKIIEKYKPYTFGLQAKHDELISKFYKTLVLKGECGNIGNTRGMVHVIHNVDKIQKTKHKMVIVCKLTSPKLTSLIKKSLAVITDEGGILSHAAVVCREFDIPCLIGTKVGTKVLKDGDIVKVDASNGIVKKIL